MFIGISGTHGTGKTTFMYKLAHDMKIRHGGKRIKLLSEVARSCPFGIFGKQGTTSSIDAQLWIFASQMQAELTAKPTDVIISDRTIYDTIAYTMEVDEDLAAEMLGLAQYLVYDLVYFVRPSDESWCVDDGDRSLDFKLRDRIDDNLQKLLYSNINNVKEIVIKKMN